MQQGYYQTKIKLIIFIPMENGHNTIANSKLVEM